MRIKHFFGLAVLAAMTASCSSNNDLVVGGGNGSGENESGASYASITIDLPTTSGTRAANDDFNEGTASEYAVNDATLLIFKKAGTSENDYTFVETAKLGNLEPWKKDNTVSQLRQLSLLSSSRLQLVRMVIIMHWSSLIMRQEQETKLPFLQVPLLLLLHMELGMLRQMQQTFY